MTWLDGFAPRRALRAVGVRVLAMCALLWAAGPAAAHKASDAYLQLRELSPGVELRWDVALRDLDAMLDLDVDSDGQLTWGEIKAGWPAVDRLLAARVQIAGCTLTPTKHGLEQRGDGAYAVVWLQSDCVLPAELRVTYTMLREIDPTHRGLLKVVRPGQPLRLLVLDPANAGGAVLAAAAASSAGPPASAASEPTAAPTSTPALSVTAPEAAVSAPAALAPAGHTFIREGVFHILTGYDHVLFLLTLLLPAVIRRQPARPGEPDAVRAVGRLSEAVWPIVGIVTAFTVAHSITLALAALNLVSLSSRIIEPAIAVTIVLAAVDNLRPLFRLPRAAVTFLFGLIHGFGFAGVLAELELPPSEFAWALLQFNVGLELGQLSIVLVAVTVLYALRHWRGYAAWVVRGGSLLAIVIASLWFIERVANVSILGV